MAEIRRIILDASIAIAGLLQLSDEPFTHEADVVLEDFRSGRVILIA